MSTQSASPQNVSSGISAIAAPPRLVVAERVDVRRRVVRGDDDLGVERRPARRPRPCARCAAGSASAGRTGAAATPRESGCERSITRRAISTPFRRCPCRPGRCGARPRRPSARRLAARAGRVADDARRGDVAEHVHRHDHARPLRAHPVAAERRPREAGLPHRRAAVPGVARRAVHLDALAERQRERRLRLLGVDQRPLDVGEHVGREVPPLRRGRRAGRSSRSSG